MARQWHGAEGSALRSCSRMTLTVPGLGRGGDQAIPAVYAVVALGPDVSDVVLVVVRNCRRQSWAQALKRNSYRHRNDRHEQASHPDRCAVGAWRYYSSAAPIRGWIQVSDGTGQHAGSSATPGADGRPVRQRSWGQVVFNVVTALVAVGGLVLGVINSCQANSRPEVKADAPKLVRMFVQPLSGTTPAVMEVLIQPTFTLIKTTTRTALIQNVTLRVTKPDGTMVDPRDVFWQSESESIPDTVLSQNRDAAPFVVTQESPRSLYLLFGVANPAQITPGRWQFNLEAHTLDNDSVPLPFCVDVAPNWADFVNRSVLGSQLLPIFRNDVKLREDPSDCYRGSR